MTQPKQSVSEMATSHRGAASRRTNEQWLSELRGDLDPVRQGSAIIDLSRYMTTVAFNALLKRRESSPKLFAMDFEALTDLAEDFSQDVMLKLALDNFGVLDQYQGKAKFTSWVAMIVNNEISSEFRRVHWRRVQPFGELSEALLSDSKSRSPEALAINQCLGEALNRGIGALPPNMRTALIRCVLHEERAAAVAADLGVTANAVYSLVHRAKRALQAELLDYQIA